MPSYPSPPFPVIARGTKRSHAKRSCLACRRQKARCELPVHAMDFPSSRDELPIEHSCHRCKTLGIPCIIYDEQLKGRRQKVAGNTNPTMTPSQNPSTSARPSPRSPGRSVDTTQMECERSSAGFFCLFWQESLRPSSPSPQTAMNTIFTQDLPLRHSTSMPTPDISVMWRPVVMLTELLARQPEFGSRSRPELGIASTMSSPTDIVDVGLGNRIETSFQPYYVWIPHLPSPNYLRHQHSNSPTLSSSLLLSTMYLLALKNVSDGAQMEDIRIQLNGLIQRDLTRVLLSAPVDIYAVQALELLAVYAPFDFGYAEVPTGTALIAVAKRIAMALQLVEAPAAVMRLRAVSDRDRGALDEALQRATIYYSLRVWELSFAFNDPHLPQIPQELEELDAEDVMSPESSPHRDLLFRVVGRIAVSHRLRSLRKFYHWSHGISVAAKTGTLPDTLNKISKLLTVMFSEVEDQRKERSFAFRPYMEDPSVALISEWIEMETRSGHLNILSFGLSHAFGLKHFFVSSKRASLLDLFSHVTTTPPMSTFLHEWGLRLADIAERVLAGFVGMEQHDPFANIPSHTSPLNRSTLHAHSAPPMTTCAIVIAATTSLTETHAALFMKWGKSSERVESYLVILRQTAKLLAAMDPARSIIMGSIPAASAQMVITMTSMITSWLTIVRSEPSNHPPSALVTEDSRQGPSLSTRSDCLRAPTSSNLPDSAPDALWQWPIQSIHPSSLGDAPAQDIGMQRMPSGSPLASDPPFDRLDVDVGSFDWAMFTMHGTGHGSRFE